MRRIAHRASAASFVYWFVVGRPENTKPW